MGSKAYAADVVSPASMIWEPWTERYKALENYFNLAGVVRSRAQPRDDSKDAVDIVHQKALQESGVGQTSV